MTVKAYGFGEKLAEGEAGEAYLDSIWGGDYQVCRVGRDQQRRGIDRVLIHKESGRRVSIEYKTDATAGRTGNAFVETVSVSTTGKPGWAVASQAMWLVYYIPSPRTIYCIRMGQLRKRLPVWAAMYPTRNIPNEGYVTQGILVPLDEFERIANWVTG